MVHRLMDRSYGAARKIVVAVVGGTVVVIGIAMLVLPGPAVVVIPLGLGILALEFAWARHWRRRLKEKSNSVRNRLRRAPVA